MKSISLDDDEEENEPLKKPSKIAPKKTASVATPTTVTKASTVRKTKNESVSKKNKIFDSTTSNGKLDFEFSRLKLTLIKSTIITMFELSRQKLKSIYFSMKIRAFIDLARNVNNKRNQDFKTPRPLQEIQENEEFDKLLSSKAKHFYVH